MARDGREGDLETLIVEHPFRPGTLPPWLGRVPERGDLTYIVLAHPDDVSRRILDEAVPTVRDALFGFDLERGVVLRGRLRGLWCRDPQPDRLAFAAYARFLDEPLPLTT